VKTAHGYLLRGPSYIAGKSPLAVMQNFQLLNGYYDTIRLPNPENRRVGENSVQLSFMGTELYRFEVPIGRNANFKKLGHKIFKILIENI